MTQGFMQEGDSSTKPVVELEWLRKGRFNGKFFKAHPTFTTARILQETEKAYLLAGKAPVVNGKDFGFYKGIWIPKSDVQVFR